MLATVGTKPVLFQRVKLLIVAALLALSLALGFATTTQHVGAETDTAIRIRGSGGSAPL